jgi:aspartokinase
MNVVTKLTVTEDVALITFHNTPTDIHFLSDLFSYIADKSINVDMISQTAPMGGYISVSFTIASADLGSLLEIGSTLRTKYPAIRSSISDCNAKISLYGEAMREVDGVSAQAFCALAGANIDLLLVTTSEVDLSMLVSSADLENAVAVLKASFAD